MASARGRPQLTHFLCIPLATPASRPALSASLAALHADATNPYGGAGEHAVPAAAVRPVGSLHLTLGVMSFPRDEGLERALALLRSLPLRELLGGIRPPVLPGALPAGGEAGGEAGKGKEVGQTAPARLRVTLRGLHAMQTPAQASVLYAPPLDPEGTLQQFCERVRAVFREADMVVEDRRPLLLHATVLNTIYAKGKGGGNRGRGRGGGRGGRRDGGLTFDARGLLERFEDHLWAEGVEVEKVAICRMGAKKVEVDGVADEAYEVVGEVGF